VPQLPIILGITQQGKPITLYKCIINNWSYPLVGLGGGRYRAHFIFEGVHFEAEEKIRFNQLCGNYTDLDAWVDIYGHQLKWILIANMSQIRYENLRRNLDVGETARLA
jgi:hypothetical protein